MRIKGLHIKFIWGLLFAVLLFNRAEAGPEAVTKVFSYFDEIMTLVCLCYLFLHCKTAGIKKNKQLISLWLLFILIGLLGTMIWRGQGIVPVLQDLLTTCSKFIIGYLAAYAYFLRTKKDGINGVICIAKAITVLLFLFSLHDLFFSPWFQTADFRYIMDSQQLLFAHPTYLTHAAATLLLLFAYEHLVSGKYLKYMLMASFLIVIALRAKGIGFLGAFWFVYIFIFVMHTKRRGFIYFGAGVTALLFGFDLIESYFLDATRFSPRKVLLLDSVKLMKTYFPIGTGFASFASSVAASYYSPLYDQLGYGEYWGMAREENMFLSDSFWPCIIGQFGFIGTILFLTVLVVFAKKIIRIFRNDKKSGFIMLMILGYMLISSMAETSFFNPTSMLLFMYFAYVEVRYDRSSQGKNQALVFSQKMETEQSS